MYTLAGTLIKCAEPGRVIMFYSKGDSRLGGRHVSSSYYRMLRNN